MKGAAGPVGTQHRPSTGHAAGRLVSNLEETHFFDVAFSSPFAVDGLARVESDDPAVDSFLYSGDRGARFIKSKMN